ncbi:B3 domain-containing transcription factor VRN1-like [Quercus robur]|uniref:B3 domain-containing transcription factor VRN1-like n=1 Tax=Quercus robur TaxID=38942 RepID=UPI0021613BED|nr:B3 domain-containing transcription factor VRN1-like [Quercus robur]
MAFLTIPNGTKWKVLTKRDGEAWFQNGWCEFASYHALILGHLLVFRYEGNSQFSVLIFDATTIEIDYPLDDQLQVRRMEDNESDDNSLEIMDGFMPSRKTGEKPPLPCPLPHKRAKTNPTRLAYGVGGNRVGCKSSPLVKLESDCNLDDVSFSHDQFPKKDGGVAENLVRANAFKSENPLFTVIIHPSYINGKDRASLPHGIINYLPRKGFTKDYTKGSILTVKLQVVD